MRDQEALPPEWEAIRKDMIEEETAKAKAGFVEVLWEKLIAAVDEGRGVCNGEMTDMLGDSDDNLDLLCETIDQVFDRALAALQEAANE